MSDPTKPTFSKGRRWGIRLNLGVTILAAAAVLVMVNYLGARHYRRLAVSGQAVQLSGLTCGVLDTVTNLVKVTVFFDREAGLYKSVIDLLEEYQFASAFMNVSTLDYVRDPARAELVRAKHRLNSAQDKNVVIFECQGRTRIVYESELSELDLEPLVTGQSREVRRTGFKGELLFTSAVLNVTSVRPMKAYFLEGHRELSPKADDPDKGYSKFAALLKTSNVDWALVSLNGTNEVPADCSLLILPGPVTAPQPEELDKIRRYLRGGGRLFVLFSYYGLGADSPLADLLLEWGVRVGRDLVEDLPNSNTTQDVVLGNYGPHLMTKPLLGSRIHMIVPRSVRARTEKGPGADAPDVAELFYTGPKGTIISNFRDGVPYRQPGLDFQTNVCLAVAVEKGKIRDVNVDRGTTRLVITGDSFFLNNRMIDSAANRDFANLAINWLLDRSQLVSGLGPRAVFEYKLNVTRSQMSALRWILWLVFPGVVLLVGFAVWTRRRR